MKPEKTTIAVSIDKSLAVRVRQEAMRQRRPISWVVQEYIAKGLGAHDHRPTKIGAA